LWSIGDQRHAAAADRGPRLQLDPNWPTAEGEERARSCHRRRPSRGEAAPEPEKVKPSPSNEPEAVELPALTGGGRVAPGDDPSGGNAPRARAEADRDERLGPDDMEGECCALLRRQHPASSGAARPLRRRRR